MRLELDSSGIWPCRIIFTVVLDIKSLILGFDLLRCKIRANEQTKGDDTD